MTDKPKNVGELIKYLMLLDPSIEFVTPHSDDPLSFQLCTYEPPVTNMVCDGYHDGGWTYPHIGSEKEIKQFIRVR